MPSYDVEIVSNEGRAVATITTAEPLEDTPLVRRSIAVGLQEKRGIWGVSVKDIRPSEESA